MDVRLGDLLIESGALTPEQVAMILEMQADSTEPFGLIAERECGIDPAVIESTWARQYARRTRTIDPADEPFDADVVEMITRRQCWQFRILPIRFEGPELMAATTDIFLPRALRFAANVIGYPIFFVMSEPVALGRALCAHRPLPGFTETSLLDGGFDGLLRTALHR